MEGELNVSYFILDRHVEHHRFRYLYFTVVLTVYVLILCSNCTVVYLICKQPDLHEPMCVFIAALLLNSVVFSTNIYPKLLLDFLSDTQVISHKACLLRFFLFYTSGNSEFLLLAAMAYDRYVSICRPLHYPSIMRRSTVSVLVASTWFVPACQVVATTATISSQSLCSFRLRGIFCNSSVYSLLCVTSRVSVFGVFTLLNSVVLSVIFIVFTYTRILLICYCSSADVRRKAAHTCLPHLLVLINLFFLVTYDVVTVRVNPDLPKTAFLIMTLELVSYNPLSNPLIYGLKMKEIQKNLKKLFCAHENS
ncbi:olfactory receptor 11G2-like [Betta splendens]|uniref:Olfactory receptor n=1 Tax=Betta splendens TaxID=158456 RepID=A0A6P7LEP2_BETSP|nr:olfactory receptor 11G2-like [Betta splendens]